MKTFDYPTYLIEKLFISTPLLGVYDAPELNCFDQLLSPKSGGHTCMFAFFKAWQKGAALELTEFNFGCGGCGYWWFGREGRTREQFVRFLKDDEGLKATDLDMHQWLDSERPYVPENGHLYLGPLKEEAFPYLKTVTFFVNPDQLSALIIGANYFHHANEPNPVYTPFGSGCMELLPLAESAYPQAVVSTTDLAMRHYLPPNLMGFTVNRPMYENLCRLDERSFLDKPFLSRLVKARGGSLG